jgi:hypothetical protein
MRPIFSGFFLFLTLSQHVAVSSTVEAEKLPEGTVLFSTESEALLSGEQKKFYESAGGIRPHKKLVRIQRAALDGEAVSLALFDNKSARLELQRQPGEPVWKGRANGLVSFPVK